jgi:hypothetical protein
MTIAVAGYGGTMTIAVAGYDGATIFLQSGTRAVIAGKRARCGDDTKVFRSEGATSES